MLSSLFKNNPKKGAIISIAKGGVGNQLFIYSAGRSLAENLGYQHFIDDHLGFLNDSYNRKYLLDKFQVSSQQLPERLRTLKSLKHPKHKLIRTWNKLLPLELRNYIAESHGLNPQKFQNFKTRRQKVILNGNWCDENFFIRHNEIIKNDLKLPVPLDSENTQRLEKIKNSHNSAFIHVRRVRYKSKLDISYYLKAKEKLESTVGKCKFFLFADDFDWAKEKFKRHIDFTPVQHNKNDELVDLWLMSHCQNAIIANSGFSWWAAWLIKDDKKVVISPNNQSWHIKPASGWHRINFQP